MREKYSEDKLDFEDGRLIKDEKKIDALEMDLQEQKMTGKNTDISIKPNQVLKVLPNLSQLYVTGDNDTKKTVISSICSKTQISRNNFPNTSD